MDKPEDLAWCLRKSMSRSGTTFRLDTEAGKAGWLEKLTDRSNKVHTVLLLETGGAGVAQRLRAAQGRAKEIGAPLKVLNSMSAAETWVHGLVATTGNKPEQRRNPPVRWLDGPGMTEWLERFYPRRRMSWQK